MRAGWLAVAALSCAFAWESPSAARLLDEANRSYRQLRPADAIRLYREYLTLYPDRSDVRAFLGAALLNMNDQDEALAQAKHAIRLDAGCAKAYVLEGRIFTAREQWDLAFECFRKAIELAPEDSDTWYFAGLSSYQANRFENAIREFNRSLATGTPQSRIYENLGLSYEALDRSSEAEGAFKQALVLDRQHYRPAFALGRFLFKQGRTSEALPLLRDALRLAPEAAEVRFELGRALYQSDQLDQAVAVLKGGDPAADCRLYWLLAKVYRLQRASSAADEQSTLWLNCSSRSHSASGAH